MQLNALVVAVLVAACDKGASTGSGSAAHAVPETPLPRVDAKAAFAPALALPPPALIWLHANGELTIAPAPAQWATFVAPRAPTTLATIERDLFAIVRARGGAAAGELDALLAERAHPVEKDDLGVRVEPELGKLGKPDPDRPEGQYKMQRPDDPAVVRHKTLRDLREGQNQVFDLGEPNSERRAAGVGAWLEELPPFEPVVVASPDATAVALVRLLGRIGGALAVSDGHGTAALRVGFTTREVSPGRASEMFSWIEITIRGDKLDVQTQSGPKQAAEHRHPPVQLTTTTDKLAATFKQLAADDRWFQRIDVDVLVGPETNVQRLVEVVAAVDLAGAHRVSVGEAR